HLWHSINRMYNQRGVEYDLTTSTGFVLLNIDSQNGIPATKIAPLLGMEPRSLSRMLKTLEEKGLIYRQSDNKDKRLVRIFLTEDGKEKKDIAKQTVKQFNHVVQQAVSKDKLSNFFDVIADLQRIIETNQIFNF
ncbi:MAG: MarR family transcriptional regulator, partial [Flavobacteriales bacterium]|nr:MarR family transcriptional regulator [Flavobacteriales bacterium]